MSLCQLGHPQGQRPRNRKKIIERRQEDAANGNAEIIDLVFEPLDRKLGPCSAVLEFSPNAAHIGHLAADQPKGLFQKVDIAKQGDQRLRFVTEKIGNGSSLRFRRQPADRIDDLERCADGIFLHGRGDFRRIHAEPFEGFLLSCGGRRSFGQRPTHIAERRSRHIRLSASTDHGRTEGQGLFLAETKELALNGDFLGECDQVGRRRSRVVRDMIDGVRILLRFFHRHPERRLQLGQILAGLSA
ncbi:hypothetical protein SAMN05216456_1693 [Devosia crocina]|uniref:Uncharacterized protein n=1 Tax=Devosia crocina TaxID=429728 RepID=A0A1I7ND11_9HYPH|nr:hypothetical protein [Devosia crocina]SFV32567.1 hypothetical protein SAMN05216456_1693 [Devosia crocina]